jgi:predicted secreted Zn-dependent protease
MLRLALFPLLLALPAHATEWQATERTDYYPVSGTTGIALYESIGANGPVISGKGKSARRTIALTEYDLKWRRDYRPQGTACTLAAATPLLTIIYRLPKPRGKLSGATARAWQTFAGGMAAHEKVHGDLIRARAQAIVDETVGLTVENDPDCAKTRAEVQARALKAHEAYKTRSRAFDAKEMSDGGNVHRLILGLVNGEERSP